MYMYMQMTIVVLLDKLGVVDVVGVNLSYTRKSILTLGRTGTARYSSLHILKYCSNYYQTTKNNFESNIKISIASDSYQLIDTLK
ncbi:hypothetical protein PF005_g31216 [Phytophthora fragariae]|uniref:Uncharacterized protein n=1 Tax=Phytophthora fragariae TaxID=53985 RepID=A0A6A3GNX3_9STRA|nr:hypothetical protein PF003_g40919 [Phytophthora fragariae]KAE8959359.1 hypothetical protein PF011_g30462 [Phytophthora fragariae]KAE9161515.1 hypothetical protein PF005_g31216 [Phytophthora fragariae]